MPVPAPPVSAELPAPVAEPGSGRIPWVFLIAGGFVILLFGGAGLWFLRRRDEEGEHSRSDRGRHARFDLVGEAPPEATNPADMPEGPVEPSPPPPAESARSTAQSGAAPKRAGHAVFDLGAIASPEAEPVPQPVERAHPAPEAVRTPVPPTPPPATTHRSRAALDIELKPKRAGTNLLSAAVDYDVVVHNSGDAVAKDVRVDVRLLSAGAEQDGWIGRLFASPIERPITPPFDLPPGGAIELSGMAMLPREAVSVMNVQGRALFVPVLAINLLYAWDGGSGQTATSHVVGIDRGEGAKMAPFRLDGPPRMHEGVSQLAYTVSVRR